MEDVENTLSTTLRAGFSKAEENSNKVMDSLELFASSNSATAGHVQELCERLDQTNEILQDQRTEQASSIETIICQLRDLKSLLESLPRENRILRRLQFASILQRERSIDSPASDTFTWILSGLDAPSRILTPLGHVGPGSASSGEESRQIASSRLQMFLAHPSSTFFLYGKAGCGKSTLMKFLAHHRSVRNGLQEWAGNRKLVVISLFFWRSDDPLQKSLEGFYRAILYHTLGQVPELIPKLFPGWDAISATDAVEFQIHELQEAFARLIEHTRADSRRFCYFIDGLDEYEGDSSDHKHLAEQLVSWTNSDAVKIVCSARPDTIFLNVFNASGASVNLGRLNEGDITELARSRFETKLCQAEYATGRESCQGLVQDIVKKAEGVFVWAVLVVRSLINGVLEGDDDKASLRARVKDFPTNLNDMFRHMLSRIDQAPYVRRRSDVLLFLVANNKIRRPFNALLCSWLEDLRWCQNMPRCDFPFDSDLDPYTPQVIEERLAKAPKLLHLLTQGLLEIQEIPSTASGSFLEYRIEFFHRSVRDFLREEYQSKSLFLSVDDEIQTYLRLYIAEVQFLPGEPENEDIGEIFEDIFIWLADLVREKKPAPFQYLHQLERIISKPLPSTTSALAQPIHALGYSPRWPGCFFGRMLVTECYSRRWHNLKGYDCSFFHWAAYWQQGHYVRQRLASGITLKDVDTENLNLLFSAAVGTDIDLVRDILAQEPSEQLINIFLPAHTTWRRVPVWTVVLRDFVNNVLSYYRKRRRNEPWPLYLDMDWLRRYAIILEELVRAGADPNVEFIVDCHSPKATQKRLTLDQILQIMKPPNLVSLRELLLQRRRASRTATDPGGVPPLVVMDDLLRFDWQVQYTSSRTFGWTMIQNFEVFVF